MLFFLLLGVSVGALLWVNTQKGTTSRKRDCYDAPYGEPKIHKWVLKFEADRRGYLVCKECGKIPGDD